MTVNMIRCGMLGADEKDLSVLSELHRQDQVQIAFVYDRKPDAVGLEIAEILAIAGYRRPEDLGNIRDIDYVVVSEPRARFAQELKALSDSGAKILNPTEAIQQLCSGEPVAPRTADVPETGEPYTVDDTLAALERLFDRGELLKFLLEVAVKATASHAGSIMLYSSDARELYIAYATGLSERVIKNTRQKLGVGIAGKVALNKQAQLIHLPPDTSLYSGDRERMDIASAISVPLLWSGDLLGVLNVSSGEGDRSHTEEDLKQLKTLSRRLSRVLFESLKLQEVQMRHRESRFRTTMGEIADAEIPSREKFSVLSRYLGELTGADTVEIFLSTSEGDWFVLGGSSSLLSPKRERLRYQKGALSRAFLEERSIVLTESAEPGDDPFASLSSAVYCPLELKGSGGVVVLEFSERSRLDDFLVIKGAIVTEISRFVSSEMRERKLRRKLEALGKISDAAPAVLGCRSIEDLASVLTRIVADVLECERVSVRLRRLAEDDRMRVHVLTPPGESSETWQKEDERQFTRLSETKKPFSVAFLNFEIEVRNGPAESHSILAVPIEMDERFCGGVIAYSKHPGDPLEDAVFTELDSTLVDNLNRLILPVLDSIYKRQPMGEADEAEAYGVLLEANIERFKKICDSEILRSNRYHNTFAVILFRVNSLERLFEQDRDGALALVGEITQGIRTRTRKTDYGCWINATTYAMLSLEGGNRIRFLISRAMMYLVKDLSAVEGAEICRDDILVGVSVYPGTGRSAEELLNEAETDLKPHSG